MINNNIDNAIEILIHDEHNIANKNEEDETITESAISSVNGKFDTFLPPVVKAEENLSMMGSSNFFQWREVFPELSILQEKIDVIREEANTIGQWVPWPEDHFLPTLSGNSYNEWTVFPLMHTFPAYDESKISWIESTCNHCPETAKLLKKLPTIRTALFSKLGPGTKLSTHTGWADLANHVLRCHISLDIPDEERTCGLLVNGDLQYHRPYGVIVFDDSRPHRAFNCSDYQFRTVLIVDLLRPSYIAKGIATGQHTPELDSFVSKFK